MTIPMTAKRRLPLLLAGLFLCLSTAAAQDSLPDGANLRLWLKADTGLTLTAAGGVSRWKDWSGAGRDAATTSSTFPKYVANGWNGMPAVNFNGIQKMTFPQLNMADFTVCAVYRLAAASKPWHFWLAGIGWGLTAGGTTTGTTGWGAFEGSSFLWRLARGTPVDWGQVTITNDKLYRNGAEPSYQITGALTGLAVSTIGSRPERDDHSFVGDIAEVLVYDRTLTAAERAMVEDYLRARYNVSGPSTGAAPALIARGAPVLQGLQLQLPGSGVHAIDIFTPRGARAGSFQLKAPGTFDLSHAGLSNGVYQIRVRAGADIFWLKAPVVR